MGKNRVKKPPGPTKVCPYCNYGGGGEDGVWNTRVANPKECPRCKRYLRNPAKDIIIPPKIEPPTLKFMSGPPGPMIAALMGQGPKSKD